MYCKLCALNPTQMCKAQPFLVGLALGSAVDIATLRRDPSIATRPIEHTSAMAYGGEALVVIEGLSARSGICICLLLSSLVPSSYFSE